MPYHGPSIESLRLLWDAEPDGDWRAEAACKDSDPDTFFPTGSKEQVADATRLAKEICRYCVVREPCLEFALTTNQENGIWGGLDEPARRKYRRRWISRQSA